MKVVQKIKTHILYSITSSRKSCRLRGNVEKYCGAREATTDNTVWRMRVAWWISMVTRARSHTHKHAPTRAYAQRNM